jgi:DNA excision repair protein ERCC-1
MTLMLAWNEVEAGRILETYKLYENKPPDMIMEKTGTRVKGLHIFPFLQDEN